MNWLARSRMSAWASASWCRDGMHKIQRRLGGPDAGGVVRDTLAKHTSPGGDVYEEQQVEPAHRDRVDGGEVAGDGGIGPHELRPSDFRACGGGVDSGLLRICQTVDAARRWPSPASSPWMRR